MEDEFSKFDQKNITGKDAIRFEQDYEDAIRALTDYLLDSGELGVNSPKVYEKIGGILTNIFQIATCQWGCQQGDHVIENLSRRFYNSGCATLRLMGSGLYDEALGPIRTMAELANLLQAFEKDRKYLEGWKAASSQERQNKFSPFRVRLFLESLKVKPIVSKEVYSKLCEEGVHVSPISIYRSHDLVATLHAGGHFAMPGVFLILNTLAWVAGPYLLSAARLAGVSEEKYQILRNHVIDLLYVAQGLKIDNYEEFQKLRSDYLQKIVSKNIDEMNEQEWAKIANELEEELREKGENDKLNSMSEEEIMSEFGPWIHQKISKQVYRKLQEQNLQETIIASQVALAQQIKKRMLSYDKSE